MELRNYLRVIRRGWWLIVPALLIAVVSGLVFTYTQTPIYRTEATYVVSPSASLGQFNEVMSSLNMLSKREGIMSTYVEIAASNTILDAVYKDLGLTRDELRYLKVSSELVPSTNIVKVSVESHDPLIAKAAADLVGQNTIEYVETLYEAYDMKPLDLAYIPGAPSKPDLVRNLALSAILGLFVGVGGAFLLEYLRSTETAIAQVNIIDGDTGIYNRYYFMERLAEELSRAKRSYHPVSVALMNIERLDVATNINIPNARNEALRQVALFLKDHLREGDLVARFESSKLALLLPDTPGSDAKKILEMLQVKLAWTVFDLSKSGVKIFLTSSSGIAAFDFNNRTGRDEVLDNAAKALQSAANNGSTKICLFNETAGDTIIEEENENQYDPETEQETG